MPQLTLTNQQLDEEKIKDIIMEITFTIKETDSLYWDGKAHPEITSGCMFGGAVSYEGKDQIDNIISTQKKWFEEGYCRPVKEKIKIIDQRKKQKELK